MNDSHRMSVESKELEIAVKKQKKEQCSSLYRELKRDLTDLASVDFRPHWFYRAACLKAAGCWWHYKIILRKAREYLSEQGDYWGYSYLLRQVKKNQQSALLEKVGSSCLYDESGRDLDD